MFICHVCQYSQNAEDSDAQKPTACEHMHVNTSTYLFLRGLRKGSSLQLEILSHLLQLQRVLAEHVPKLFERDPCQGTQRFVRTISTLSTSTETKITTFNHGPE
jgi:hypothetical protein